MEFYTIKNTGFYHPASNDSADFACGKNPSILSITRSTRVSGQDAPLVNTIRTGVTEGRKSVVIFFFLL